jgi:hypothetical protein
MALKPINGKLKILKHGKLTDYVEYHHDLNHIIGVVYCDTDKQYDVNNEVTLVFYVTQISPELLELIGKAKPDECDCLGTTPDGKGYVFRLWWD